MSGMFLSGNKRNELYALIKRMDGPEKAYFKKMSKRYADDRQSLHVRLFSLMDECTVYDDAVFCKKLGLKNAAQYSALKNQLWNELLAALIFRKRNDNLTQLDFSIMHIGVLIRKSLIASAQRVLAIAWSYTEEFALYEAQLRLLDYRYRLQPYVPHKQYEKENLLLLEQQSQTLNRLQCHQQLSMHQRALSAMKQFSYLRLSASQLSRARAIAAQLEHMAIDADCAMLHLQHQYTSCMCHHLTYRFSDSQLHARNLFLLWQTNSRLIPHHEDIFIGSADFTFYNCFALKDIALAEEYLEGYTTLAKSFLLNDAQEQWSLMLFNTRLKIAHKKADYQEVSILVAREAAIVLSKAERFCAPAIRLSVMCSTCISYFVLEHYATAEDLLLDIIQLNEEVQREDILYFTAIFHLLILYERKRLYQLNNAISSTYARLYNKKKLQPFEKDLMLFFKQLSNELNNKGKLSAITAFLLNLEQYKNDPERELYFLYFNYYGWLESITLKISYREYISLQLKKQATTG